MTLALKYKFSPGFRLEFIVDILQSNNGCIACETPTSNQDDVFRHLNVCPNMTQNLLHDLILQRVEDTTEEVKIDLSQSEKRPRGRPRKSTAIVESIKKKRGRPKKSIIATDSKKKKEADRRNQQI